MKELNKPYIEGCWELAWLQRCSRICSRIVRKRLSIEEAIADVARSNKGMNVDDLRDDWNAFYWAEYRTRKKGRKVTLRKFCEEWAKASVEKLVDYVAKKTGSSVEQILRFYRRSPYRPYWTQSGA